MKFERTLKLVPLAKTSQYTWGSFCAFCKSHHSLVFVMWFCVLSVFSACSILIFLCGLFFMLILYCSFFFDFLLFLFFDQLKHKKSIHKAFLFFDVLLLSVCFGFMGWSAYPIFIFLYSLQIIYAGLLGQYKVAFFVGMWSNLVFGHFATGESLYCITFFTFFWFK